MSISSTQIQRAIRDFENIISDLSITDYNNYQRRVQRLVVFSQDNKIIQKIIEPLLNVDLDTKNIIIDHKNGRGSIKVPVDVNEHIAFVLQLFYEFSKDDNSNLVNFALTHFRADNFNDCIDMMNERVVIPAMRELINIINDYVEDDVEENDALDLSSIQVFNIGSITNEDGNIAIGHHISISPINNIDNLSDEFLKVILSKGYSVSDYDKIRNEINQIKEEAKKSKPDEGVLRKAFQKVKGVGNKIFVEILVKLISKPVISAIASSLL